MGISSLLRSFRSAFLLFFVATCALVVDGSASHAQTTVEEKNSRGLYTINADDVQALGATGQHVTIAIIDTGIMATHPEFGGRVLTGYNVFDGSTNTLDDNGHGTHVSGISAAGKNNPSTSGMFGVAPMAYLLPVKVLDGRGSGTSQGVANGIQFAVDRRNSLSVPEEFKPFVMNVSLGSSAPSTDIEGALKNAVSAGMAVAAAAGNDGGANPIWPARYAGQSWANGQILAVGAVDANNVIASFSNRAGDAMDFYLVAPGTSIYSTYTTLNRKTRKYTATYASLSGTSMATPYVTGAIALIKSGWSHLTAQQINAILLSSATDLGAPGVDNTYGHGLINLQAALSPLGSLNFATGSGQLVSATNTQVTSSGAFGSMSKMAAALDNMVVYDDFMRDFQIVGSALVSGQPARHGVSESTMQVLERTDSARHRVVNEDEDTWLSFSGNPGDDTAGWSYGVSRRGNFAGFGSGSGASLSFSDARWDGQGAFTREQTGASGALLDLVPDGTFVSAGFDVNSRSRLAFSVMGTAGDEDLSAAPETNMPMEARGAAVAYTVKATEDTQVSLTSSVLEEKNSFLGSYSDGALAMGSGASSASFGVGVNFRAGGGWVLGFDAAWALTNALGPRGGLVDDVSSLSSRSFALGMTHNNLTGVGDALGIALVKPLRVTDGSVDLSVPVGVDGSGVPVVQSFRAGLEPDGSETDINFNYDRPLGKDSGIGLGIVYRYDADNVSGATDAAGMARYKVKF